MSPRGRKRWNADRPGMCFLGVLVGLLFLFAFLAFVNLWEHLIVGSIAGEVTTGNFADQNYNVMLLVMLMGMMVGYYLAGYLSAKISFNSELKTGLILSLLAAIALVSLIFLLPTAVGEKPFWFHGALNILGTITLMFGASARKHRRMFH